MELVRTFLGSIYFEENRERMLQPEDKGVLEPRLGISTGLTLGLPS